MAALVSCPWLVVLQSKYQMNHAVRSTHATITHARAVPNSAVTGRSMSARRLGIVASRLFISATLAMSSSCSRKKTGRDRRFMLSRFDVCRLSLFFFSAHMCMKAIMQVESRWYGASE